MNLHPTSRWKWTPERDTLLLTTFEEIQKTDPFTYPTPLQNESSKIALDRIKKTLIDADSKFNSLKPHQLLKRLNKIANSQMPPPAATGPAIDLQTRIDGLVKQQGCRREATSETFAKISSLGKRRKTEDLPNAERQSDEACFWSPSTPLPPLQNPFPDSLLPSPLTKSYSGGYFPQTVSNAFSPREDLTDNFFEVWGLKSPTTSDKDIPPVDLSPKKGESLEKEITMSSKTLLQNTRYVYDKTYAIASAILQSSPIEDIKKISMLITLGSEDLTKRPPSHEIKTKAWAKKNLFLYFQDKNKIIHKFTKQRFGSFIYKKAISANLNNSPKYRELAQAYETGTWAEGEKKELVVCDFTEEATDKVRTIIDILFDDKEITSCFYT